jgi:hypothetical protein
MFTVRDLLTNVLLVDISANVIDYYKLKKQTKTNEVSQQAYCEWH